MNKTPAYSYIRFSSERQNQGNSLERQEQLLANYLSNNPHIELQDTSYKDLGVSGYTGKHKSAGALGAFLSACEQQKVPVGSFLLVESIDRLGRLRGVEFLELIIDLFRYVTVVTLEDNQRYDSRSFDGHAAFSLQAKIQQAHNYSKQLSERLIISREATRTKLREGKTKKLTKNCPAWLEWSEEDDCFIELADRVKTVNRIFELYALEGLGTTAIANRLNRDEVKCFNGKGWHGSYIAKILFDRKVIGELKSKNDEVFSGYYPKIISVELFLLTQQQKEARSKNFRVKNSENVQPFDIYNGIVFCECGAEAKLYNKGSGSYIYQCRNRARGMCPIGSSGLNKSDLVFHFGHALDAALINNTRREKKNWIMNDERDNALELESLKSEEANLRDKITTASDLAINAVDSVERENLKNKINLLRSGLADTQLKIKGLQENEVLNRLNKTFLMTAIGDHGVDWRLYLEGDTRRIVPLSDAINLNKWLKSNGTIIKLHPNFQYSLYENKDLLFMTMSKPHRSSKAMTSYLWDGDLYISVDEDGTTTYGDTFEFIELMDYSGDNPIPIDPQIYIK